MGRKHNAPNAPLSEKARRAVLAEIEAWGNRPIAQWPGGPGDTPTTAIARAAEVTPKAVREWRKTENYRAAVRNMFVAYIAGQIGKRMRKRDRSQSDARRNAAGLPVDFDKPGRRDFYTWEAVANLWDQSGGRVESPIEAEIVDGEVKRKVYTDRNAYIEHLVKAGALPIRPRKRETSKS